MNNPILETARLLLQKQKIVHEIADDVEEIILQREDEQPCEFDECEQPTAENYIFCPEHQKEFENIQKFGDPCPFAEFEQ